MLCQSIYADIFKSTDLILPKNILLDGTAAGVRSRYQKSQLNKLSAVQRKGFDFLSADHCADRRGLHIQRRNLVCNIHGFQQLPSFHGH